MLNLNEPTPIHETLKAYRLERRRTQAEVASAIGIDPTCYMRIEKGKRNLLAEEARRAAKFLKVSPTALFRDRSS